MCVCLCVCVCVFSYQCLEIDSDFYLNFSHSKIIENIYKNTKFPTLLNKEVKTCLGYIFKPE